MNPAEDANARPLPLTYAPGPPSKTKSRLITGGVLTGIVLILIVRFVIQETRKPTAPAIVPSARVPAPGEPRDIQLKDERQQLWQAKVDPRLKKASDSCNKAIDESIEVLDEFVRERKAGARPLAEAMLAFRSKWNLVISQLPWWLGGDPNAHRAFLEKKFDENIFTSEQMKQAVEAAVKTYFNHVQAVENQLLVDIRADLADFPLGVIPETETASVFSKHFEQLIIEITPDVEKSLGFDVTRELASWVGGELATRIAVRLLTAVATRLGVSAGIMSAGASASWATFGISVLAAIVIDHTVGWIMDKVTDPVGQLEARIEEMLDETTKLVVEGEGQTNGLREELMRVNNAREQLRTEALRRIVVGE